MTLKSKDFQTAAANKSKIAENISVFYFTFVIILYKETILVIRHLLVVVHNSLLYNIYSLCFIVILYFLLLTFFYSLAFAFYLFSITLRDHECPSNLLVLAINFFFFSKTQVLFSVLPKDLTKSTVLSLTSTTI